MSVCSTFKAVPTVAGLSQPGQHFGAKPTAPRGSPAPLSFNFFKPGRGRESSTRVRGSNFGSGGGRFGAPSGDSAPSWIPDVIGGGGGKSRGSGGKGGGGGGRGGGGGGGGGGGRGEDGGREEPAPVPQELPLPRAAPRPELCTMNGQMFYDVTDTPIKAPLDNSPDQKAHSERGVNHRLARRLQAERAV